MSHPYIPNSAEATQQEMLAALGIDSVEELYASIPESLRYRQPLDLPPALAEHDLRRQLGEILEQNTTAEDSLSFLGGGCWQHYVPAVCDEIATRSEFVTAYVGSPYSNLGSLQAQFEYQSLVGQLVGLDLVGSPTYDWGMAAVNGMLMASLLTGRTEVIVPATISPGRLRQMRTATGARLRFRECRYDLATGALDVEHLRELLSAETAAVYVEVPSYLGFIEPSVEEIGELAHQAGAQYVVGVDPSSLGVLAAPGDYGADMVAGDLQPLGIRMHYGGGLAGFLATRDGPEYRDIYPHLFIGMLPTKREGEYTFGWANWDETHFVKRESSEDFTGTTQVLWGIVAASYLSVMGPEGMRELGEGIVERAAYAVERLSAIDGVVGSRFNAANFKEFVVNFDHAGKTVQEINAALREHGIHGGKDLSGEFPELGASALYCVTEVHNQDDIERLATALKEVL